MKLFGKSFFEKENIMPTLDKKDGGVGIKDEKPRCAQCNCILPDEDRSITQYTTSNKRVCEKHYNEISNWSGKGWTYKEWDEVGAKKYPKIYIENNFYKKLGKY